MNLAFRKDFKPKLVHPQKKYVGVLINFQLITYVRSHKTTQNNLHKEVLITLNGGHSFGCGHLSRSICQHKLITGPCQSGTYTYHCVPFLLKDYSNSKSNTCIWEQNIIIFQYEELCKWICFVLFCGDYIISWYWIHVFSWPVFFIVS